VFDDALLDDASALAAADPSLRPLAEAGARVRREVAAAQEALIGFEGEARPRAVVAAGNDSRLLRAVLEPWSPVPFVAWPGPGLPGWVGALDAVVVMAQTSGDTSASAAVSEATRRGAALIVTCDPHSDVAEMAAGKYTTLLPVTTGDPLAAAVVALQALHLLGLGPDVDAEAVATSLDRVAEECSPYHDIVQNPAKELALMLADVNPLLWGGSVLAARAARRVAEAIRRVSGRSSLAADADHLLPVLAKALPPDPFADPYELRSSTLPPALVLLDDGTQDSVVRVQRGRLMTGAEAHGVRVKTLTCDHGPEIARYASLLSQGSYAAAYLGIGLGSDPAAL
jgi:hypothetical protein